MSKGVVMGMFVLYNAAGEIRGRGIHDFHAIEGHCKYCESLVGEPLSFLWGVTDVEQIKRVDTTTDPHTPISSP